MNSKSKAITILFSLIPGAGHMYLGYLKKGTELMTVFFLSTFFIGWLGLNVLGFILPVIWFYSFFDAFHCLEGSSAPDNLSFNGLDWIGDHPQWIGWALIILGVLVAFEEGFASFIPWEWRHYIQIGLVSVILIAGGIKLIVGTKTVEVKEESECGNGE
ncbi:MAG: hypothetical protein U9N81_07350 [Bacillota bacterium]|nr:hypothetical protein [Bacillota bacterium]